MTHAYEVDLSRQARRALKTMPRNVAAQIRAKIDALARAPSVPNPNVRKLIVREGFRLRVGDWRVLFDLDHGRLVVLVLTINPRGGAYHD